MSVEFAECPACSSKDFRNLGKPIGSELNSIYNVIECKNCSLNWCSPMASREELNNYYTRYYETRYGTVDKYPLKTKIKSIVTFKKARLKSFFSEIEKYSPEKSILDFGCGEADILYVAKQKGWRVLGVDYSNELSNKFLKDKIDFRPGSDLSMIGIDKNSFGCITAKHVIEHIPDIENFLGSIKQYLTPKGIFAVKTPSASSNRAKLGLANWHLVRPMEHFWGFNLDNFGRLMKKNNFEILYLKDNFLVDELTCIARVIN
ncbi:MAG: class I SAM-dependent methyltransferase [Ignavibacteria bacterium]|nr:class I SAM-dependent methyltransferase [Ignavibacteria bacterium]